MITYIISAITYCLLSSIGLALLAIGYFLPKDNGKTRPTIMVIGLVVFLLACPTCWLIERIQV
jgi:hypothetical protein